MTQICYICVAEDILDALGREVLLSDVEKVVSVLHKAFQSPKGGCKDIRKKGRKS